MKKSFSILAIILTLSSCSTNTNSIQNISEQTSISSKVSKSDLKIKFVDTKNIPNEVIDITQKEAQKASDKASKNRDIDYFDIHKNPVGLELTVANEKAYILNYFGTSKNTEDLNIEFRSMYTNSQNDYNFNYSGSITLSKSAKTTNLEKGKIKLNKKSSVRFELITGMPPEYIANTYENYLERQLKPALRTVYKVDTNISSDDIFPYAVYANDQVQGFCFITNRGIVRLGDRKYADLQTVTFISTENQIDAKYAVVAFNPKTKIGVAPKYEFKEISDINIVETGEW